MMNPSVTIENVDLLFCLKDTDKRVFYQNNKCTQQCGNRIGNICEDYCMKLFNEEESVKEKLNGFRFYKHRDLQGKKFDVVVFKDEEKIISILHESGSSLEKVFDDAHLTKREKEVATMRFEQGLSHLEICNKLFISKATLKTHINNILKKIPQEKLKNPKN